MSTPSSSQTSFITTAQFLNRKDWRAVAQLVMDDGTQATEGSLASNANLEAILMESSGEVESALVASLRYTSADLQAVNGISSSYLQGIVADIAMWNLFGRRPAQEPPEMVTMKKDDAWRRIDSLRNGETILAFVEVQEAGVPINEYMTPLSLNNNNLFSHSCERSLGIRNAYRRGNL